MLRFRGLVLVAVVIAVGLAAWTVLIRPRDPEPPPAAVQPVAIARDYVRSGRNLLAQQRLPEAYTAFQEATGESPPCRRRNFLCGPSSSGSPGQV